MCKTTCQFPLFALLLALSLNAWSDTSVHKCKNQLGELVYQKEPCSDGTQALETPIRTKASKAKDPVIIDKGIGGNYHLETEMNEIAVNFVIDTGATIASLPSAIAKSANVICDGHMTMNTANGQTVACTGVIEKLKFGPYTVRNIKTAIIPDLPEPLLGKNVLEQFSINQSDNRMTIAEPE